MRISIFVCYIRNSELQLEPQKKAGQYRFNSNGSQLFFPQCKKRHRTADGDYDCLVYASLTHFVNRD